MVFKRMIFLASPAACMILITFLTANSHPVIGMDSRSSRQTLDPLIFFNVSEAADITWGHAINSRALLDASLADDAMMMLEADVSLQGVDNVPFMAHSSADASDITLDEWLSRVIDDGRKGIKLDFKTKEVALASVPVLDLYLARIKVPLWLNADIISPGPADSTATAVDPLVFLTNVGAKFPQSTLSIGWTTSCPVGLCGTARYSWEHVFAMMTVIDDHLTTDATSLQPITFPVRAAFLGRSVPQLRWLLDVLAERDASLTAWTNIADVNYTSVNMLLDFRQEFPGRAVYFDLLDFQSTEFKSRKGNHSPKPPASQSDYNLSHMIQPYDPPGSVAGREVFIGSEAVVLRNGQGFRVQSAGYAEATSFEFSSSCYYSRNGQASDGMSVTLRPGCTSGSLRFSIQTSGRLALSQCIPGAGVDCSVPLQWTTVWTRDIGAFTDSFQITVTDDIARNLARFTLLTENKRRIIREQNFPSSQQSDVGEAPPIVTFDSATRAGFLVIQTVSVTIKYSNTPGSPVTVLPPGSTTVSSSVASLPFGLLMMLLLAFLPLLS